MLFVPLLPPHTLPLLQRGVPSHGRQYSVNFSNATPSHGLQFFTNRSCVGPFHGVQSCRSGLLQCGSPLGSKVLPANLLQPGLPSGHSKRVQKGEVSPAGWILRLFLNAMVWMQPAAQGSITWRKQSQPCPVFDVPPGLPLTKPSPSGSASTGACWLGTPYQARGCARCRPALPSRAVFLQRSHWRRDICSRAQTCGVLRSDAKMQARKGAV